MVSSLISPERVEDAPPAPASGSPRHLRPWFRRRPPLLGGRHPYDRMKRIIDVVGALGLLIIMVPVLVAVAGLILVTLGRPLLFRQVRPGLRGELFELVKFRTMRVPDTDRGLVTDAERMTRVGRWLRASSLDELPELWNVLRGEMSLVGPRPHLVKYLDLYTPEQARRHEVRPGITGLAQVRGRNALSWERKFAYDVAYVDTRSLRLDLRILWETVRVVLRREGVAAPGAVTWHEFRGTPPNATPPNAASVSGTDRHDDTDVDHPGRRQGSQGLDPDRTQELPARTRA